MNPNKVLNETYLHEAYTYHLTEPTFSRRVFTTRAIKAISSVTGLTIGQSFVIFNFLLLLLTGIIVGNTALSLLQNLRKALLGSLLFWLSFPVIFAFFPTIYSFDDPLLYFFLSLAILFLYRRKNRWSVVAFTGAVLARESAIILLPGIIIYLSGGLKFILIKQALKKWLPFALVSAIFILGLVIWQYVLGQQSITADVNKRFTALHYNFQNLQFSIETLFSFILVCSLAIATWRDYKLFHLAKKAFFTTLVLNSIIVVLFTQARESRLFMLPLFFWFPIAGELLLRKLNDLKQLLIYNKWFKSIVLITLALFTGFVGFDIYQPTAMKPYENWHQEYLFLLLTFTALMPYATPPPIKKT